MVAMRSCLFLTLAILLIHLTGSRGDSVQENEEGRDLKNVAGLNFNDIKEINVVNERLVREAKEGKRNPKNGKNKKAKGRKSKGDGRKKVKKVNNKKSRNNKVKNKKKRKQGKKKSKKSANKRKKVRKTKTKKTAKKKNNGKKRKNKTKKKTKSSKANAKKKDVKGKKKKSSVMKDKKVKLLKQSKRKSKSKEKQRKKTAAGKISSRQDAGIITSWPSCSTQTLNDTCLQNALDALKFEGAQIQNFFKQKSRLKSHDKITGSKLGKKGNFETTAGYMLTALGGNISNPQCGEAASNTTSSSRAAKSAVNNYEQLLNCSAVIKEACTMPNETFDDTKDAFFTECATIFETSKNISEQCRTDDANKSNATSACVCWANAARGIKLAKEKKCTASSTAKDVKKQKNKCTKAFGDCKKAEDAAVALIGACASGEIKNATQAAKDVHTVCGYSGQKSRIVGGIPTEVLEFPWMAILRFRSSANDSLFCGGSLISARWVLTACHCLRTSWGSSINADDLLVRLGEHSRTIDGETTAEDFGVVKVIQHPDFKTERINDIGLIKLDRSANFIPGCLPSQDQEFEGQLATVIGWGETNPRDDITVNFTDVFNTYFKGLATDLQKLTDLLVLPDERCVEIFASLPVPPHPVTNEMFCAGGETGKDSCQGDSGGPLMVLDSDTGESKYIVAGLVSWGIGCGRQGFPGVYTKVSKFRNWIDSTIQESEAVVFETRPSNT